MTKKFAHCYKTGPHQDLVDCSGEKFELKNGELFRDGKKIKEGVKAFFHLNKCTTYLIFEDDHIENLEYSATEDEANLKYKKVLSGAYFLAALCDNGELELALVSQDDESDSGLSFSIFFSNVDDIEFVPIEAAYENEFGALKIKTGQNFVNFPINEYQPVIHDCH